MADHILDGFRASDAHEGGDRNVSFDGEVLTVDFHRVARGDYSTAQQTKYFRLVEVQQVWQEVDGG